MIKDFGGIIVNGVYSLLLFVLDTIFKIIFVKTSFVALGDYPFLYRELYNLYPLFVYAPSNDASRNFTELSGEEDTSHYILH